MTTRERLAYRYPSLTGREADVAVGISKGLANAEIAQNHGLAVQSVKNLATTVMNKMHVANRVQVALLARGIDLKSD